MTSTDPKATDRIEQIEALVLDLIRRFDQLTGGPAGDGISRPQYLLLSVLQRQGPLSQGALGGKIGSSQSTTSELASRMAKAGLVRKIRNPEDNRIVWTAITDLGRAQLRQYRKRQREAFQRLFTEAGDKARDAFLASLERLLGILDRGAPGGDRAAR